MKYNLEAIPWEVFLQCYMLGLPHIAIDEALLKDSCYRHEADHDSYVAGGSNYQLMIFDHGFITVETPFGLTLPPANLFEIQELLEPFKIES